MTLKSMLRKYDRRLKKYYKEQMKQGVNEPSAMWICDNYHACSAGLKAAEAYLSHNGEKGLLPLFLSCRKLSETLTCISDEHIINWFSEKKLTVFQYESLQYLLFAAFAVTACEKAEGGEDTSCAVTNLLRLRDISFCSVAVHICPVEACLSDDPAGVYDKCNEKTKRLYRKAVKNGAKKEKTDELRYVEKKLEKARAENKHIGFFLDINLRNRKKGVLFISIEWLLTIILSLASGYIFGGSIITGIFLVFPVYAVLKPLYDIVASGVFEPFILPCLEESTVEAADTVIAVSCIMPEADSAEDLYSHLSHIYSSNSRKNVKLVLLADFRGLNVPEDASDNAAVSAVKRITDRLNEEYNGGFVLALRDRVYSATENMYTGFERKRGALIALAKFIRDKNSGGFSLVYGDTEGLQDASYILALDSDTCIGFEAVASLVAAARHPLNVPVTDSMKNRVVSGYGIINPVTETSIESAGKTVFSRIFTGGGVPAYANDISERYSDMFSESIFTGKGLINIDAFLQCVADKFDNDRILSHDILEGAVMRTALFSETRFTDSFPKSPKSYFARLHRWIRGDVQNLRYIFSALGERMDSPSMPLIGRYQLFDNFRRALTPVFAIVLLLWSCFCDGYYKAYLLLFSALLSVVAPDIISAVSSLIKKGPGVLRAVYFSSDLPVVSKSIIRAAASIGALPEHAFYCADAVIRATYRCLVSKKKLLQWTCAAETDNSTSRSLFRCVFVPLFFVFVLQVFGTSFHRLTAFMILLFIPLSLTDGIRHIKKAQRPSGENESRILNSFAASAWKFFEENVSPFENWLPPDNIQETPVQVKAKRTSPTNIGLYLTSCLAATDLFLITPRELYKRVNDTLSTIEKMPKFRGLLYNWYDTVRLAPLKPAYISTVDCGNFVVCLTALKEGLREYSSSERDFLQLMGRIEKILDDSDLSFLYDKNRKLFRIGFDCESGDFSSSHYDLYMSEARMTSYYECAKRHIPYEHWSNLDRTLKRSGAYVAVSSWTGTMFEYFMPVMFMPVIHGSFQYEALKVCLFLQKRFAEKAGIPYGISESCFYSTDASLNYRYKAHGLKNLALKRTADEEKVVSPYSVFLTLPFERKGALKALGRLSALHAEGNCGFYEAVDFTPERTDGEEYAIVRSYMSHHVGMTLVSLCNALRDNIFVKRFMADRYMNSARSLLEEKLPEHPRVYARVRSFHKEEKVRKTKEQIKAEIKDSPVFACGNGELTLFYDKYGNNRSIFAGKEIFRYSAVSGGISLGFSEEGENDITPLFPFCDTAIKKDRTSLSASLEKNGVRIISAIAVHPSANAILVPVKLKNISHEEKTVRIHFYAEPRLDNCFREDTNTAFSDMFIKAFRDNKANALVFGRNNGDEKISVAVGFYGKERVQSCIDREKVISRKKYAKSVFDRDYRCISDDIRGVTPVCALSTVIHLKPGECRESVIVAVPGNSCRDAVYNLYSVRRSALPSLEKCGMATFLRDSTIYDFACNFISRAFFGGSKAQVSDMAFREFGGSINSLWKCGISGDIPIITVLAGEDCPEGLLKSFVRFHKRLEKSSVASDIVFIIDGNGDYESTPSRKLMNVIKQEGRQEITGRHAGIHILYRGKTDKDSFDALIAFACCIYPDNGFVSQPDEPFIPKLSQVTPSDTGENGFIENGYKINRHPCVPWSHTLSNRSFGTLVTDNSAGFSWAYNSALCKLSAFSGSTATEPTGEQLFLKNNGKIYDLTDNTSVIFTDTCALYSSIAGNMAVRVKITVPEKGAGKEISVYFENQSDKKEEAELFYCVFPVMGEKNSFGESVRIMPGRNSVRMTNPLSWSCKGIAEIYSFSENVIYTDSLEGFFGSNKKCGGILQKFAVEPKGTSQSTFFMHYAHSQETLNKLMLYPPVEKKPYRYRFNTRVRQLNEFAGALLFHQVKDTRITARTGFYQCSGAYGYRDQLQDALAFINRDNRLVRQLIYKAASAQFYEGDVLHWFHVMYDKGLVYKGVRTRCSDDMLWLVYVTAQYILKTGDTGILKKKIPFTEGRVLSDEQRENYGEYRLSEISAELYVHCLKALKYGITRGRHSLPLFGTGDWNDSFSSVGEKGSGESVWLGMFIRKTALDFAKICEMINKTEICGYLMSVGEAYAVAIDKYAWNGKWYIRGFYDDGAPLGDAGAHSCEIDLLVQAWSVLSDMPCKERRRSALINAYNRLFDEKYGVVRLFTPPFNENSKTAGYVNRYPEGMRENGGQYTHAAVWFATALFREGMKEEGMKVLYALLPNVKYERGEGDRYKTEPYALCGDVYSACGHEGRGGWSLYTGSAGWLLQLADELEGEC